MKLYIHQNCVSLNRIIFIFINAQISSDGLKSESCDWTRVEAFVYQVEAILRKIIYESNNEDYLAESAGPLIDTPALVEILKSALLETMFEMAMYFHIPRKKCLALSLFKTAEAAHVEDDTPSTSKFTSLEKIKYSKWKRFRKVESSFLPAAMEDMEYHEYDIVVNSDDESVEERSELSNPNYELYTDDSDEEGRAKENAHVVNGVETLDSTQLFALHLISSSIDGILKGGDPVDQILSIVNIGCNSSNSGLIKVTGDRIEESASNATGHVSHFISQELTQAQVKLAKCEARLELFRLLQVNRYL